MSLERERDAASAAVLGGGVLPLDRPLDHGRVAVIDIGSSSVRLVVYDTPARLPVPMFNEKADCGLVRGLEKTGRLNEDGVERARAALSRFISLSKAMGVERLELVATAAVRDAADGLQFVEEVEDIFRVRVQVTSGAEEARLAALGLLIGRPEADGLLGDLGGGSLDLVSLDKGHYGDNATVPLGHLRLADASGGSLKKAAKIADKHFDALDWLPKLKGRTFYAVGGSWRTLAKIYIEQTDYPIHVIDAFTMGFSDAKHLAHLIAGLSKNSVEKMPSVPRRRVETLTFAALVMDRILDVARPDKLVFSGFGMREGQMLKGLPPEIRAQDPLIAGCATLAERTGRFSLSGDELSSWMTPLFGEEEPRRARLRLAACLLSDIGWTEHPDYRAEHAFYRVLRLPYAGLSHSDRAFLATAILVRYNGDLDDSFASAVRSLLEEDAQVAAEAIGLALRLAHTISGSAPGLLSRTKLRLAKGLLSLKLPKRDREVFDSETVARRLRSLGRKLDLETEVI